MSNTVKLHRVLQCTPEKLYRAFIEPHAYARWIPPDGFYCIVHRMDVRVGGTYKASFVNFSTGKQETFGGTFLELIPGELLRYNDQFDDPKMPGTMSVTVRLKKVLNGTELSIEQSGIPEMIPLEFCYVGWQQSLAHLAKLVEPEIPDGA